MILSLASDYRTINALKAPSVPFGVQQLSLAETVAELNEARCVLLLLRVDVDEHAGERPEMRRKTSGPCLKKRNEAYIVRAMAPYCIVTRKVPAWIDEEVEKRRNTQRTTCDIEKTYKARLPNAGTDANVRPRTLTDMLRALYQHEELLWGA